MYSIERLHNYSFLLSSQTCVRALRFGDVSELKAVYHKYDAQRWGSCEMTCWDYLAKVYKVMKGNYRNEYVYKNELLNSLVADRVKAKETVVLNEFGVGRSIADIVTVNGVSRAFEIKSELDSDKRLAAQMSDYRNLFEECYIVVPESLKDRYLEAVDDNVGVIIVSHSDRGAISLSEYRAAAINETVDIDVLMQSVRANEYRWMVEQAYGHLPEVSCFEMYEACRSLLGELGGDELHKLFNSVIKLRKSFLSNFGAKPKSVRQMLLGLNASTPVALRLDELYNQRIK